MIMFVNQLALLIFVMTYANVSQAKKFLWVWAVSQLVFEFYMRFIQVGGFFMSDMALLMNSVINYLVAAVSVGAILATPDSGDDEKGGYSATPLVQY